MTNSSERATAQVFSTSEYRTTQAFGLSLTAIFVGLLILNSVSFWGEPGDPRANPAGSCPTQLAAFCSGSVQPSV